MELGKKGKVMVNALTYLVAFVFNTPLFYLICLVVVVGYMYHVTQQDMKALRNDEAPFVTRASARQSLTGICERCGHQARQLHTVPFSNGSMQLCQGCAKQFHRRRPVRH